MRTESSYKSIFLLCVINEIEQNRITSPNFSLTDVIIGNFQLFYHNLRLNKPNVALPYFSIGDSNLFWNIHWKKTPQTRQLKSVSSIRAHGDTAKMSNSFYHVLIDTKSKELLKSKLIDFATTLVYEKDPVNKQSFQAPSSVKSIIMDTYDKLQ